MIFMEPNVPDIIENENDLYQLIGSLVEILSKSLPVMGHLGRTIILAFYI